MGKSLVNTVIPTISIWMRDLQYFLKSISFSKAIRVSIAVTLPIVVAVQFGQFEIGLAFSFGAFWSTPSDVVGSLRHKRISIFIAAMLVMLVSFIKGYLHFELWILLPVLGLLTFAIAYISIYGFRASLISFSGLMALALSFANDSGELEVYQYSLLLGGGGLWYLFLSNVWHQVSPKAETEEFLSETYSLTADFLETRGKLVDPKSDRKKLQKKLLSLQSELTSNHETLREILILSKKNSGWSTYQDKRLLIFGQLIDMLETAIANPGNYDRMNVLFKEHPQYIQSFQNLIFEMVYQLRMIAELGNEAHKLPSNEKMIKYLEVLRQEIIALRETLFYDEYLMLQNLLEYQEKQFQKIKRIKWILGDPKTDELKFIDRKNAQRFVAIQAYDPKFLIRNFSFKSTIFRHSIRLAVTAMIGYALGSIFDFQNPYSILLIIIVIMRPNYGLTRSRAKDRMIGTLIGGSIAFIMVFLIQDPYIFGTLGLISLIISLSLVQKNYKASATFITLSVVFFYAILSPDILSVIQFRIIDTLLGAGLSFLAMLYLWPTWEIVEIKERIESSVKANKDFLFKITEYYLHKGNVPTSYKLARKEAFLETSNLNSAFQRMTQEPKSKQREVDKIYELVVLNHSFLASLASLSTYIQSHKTTEASEWFKEETEVIVANLEKVLLSLNRKGYPSIHLDDGLHHHVEEEPDFSPLNIDDLGAEDEKVVRGLQEAHLVAEQLQWLYSISEKMLKLSTSVKLD